MLYTEYVKREFISGNLKGITIEQEIQRVAEPGEIGSVRQHKSFTNSIYIDTIIKVVPYYNA